MAYDQDQAARFCAAVAEGDKSIRAICKQKGMPSKTTVFRWLAERPEFAKMYEIAKDEAIDTHVDEAVEIADSCRNDADSIRKARLRIHARIETAQLLRPKKYGARVQLTGEGGGPIVHKNVTQMTDDELLAIANRPKDGNVPDA
jgi:transposase-like protein